MKYIFHFIVNNLECFNFRQKVERSQQPESGGQGCKNERQRKVVTRRCNQHDCGVDAKRGQVETERCVVHGELCVLVGHVGRRKRQPKSAVGGEGAEAKVVAVAVLHQTCQMEKFNGF